MCTNALPKVGASEHTFLFTPIALSGDLLELALSIHPGNHGTMGPTWYIVWKWDLQMYHSDTHYWFLWSGKSTALSLPALLISRQLLMRYICCSGQQTGARLLMIHRLSKSPSTLPFGLPPAMPSDINLALFPDLSENGPFWLVFLSTELIGLCVTRSVSTASGKLREAVPTAGREENVDHMLGTWQKMRLWFNEGCRDRQWRLNVRQRRCMPALYRSDIRLFFMPFINMPAAPSFSPQFSRDVDKLGEVQRRGMPMMNNQRNWLMMRRLREYLMYGWALQ